MIDFLGKTYLLDFVYNSFAGSGFGCDNQESSYNYIVEADHYDSMKHDICSENLAFSALQMT